MQKSLRDDARNIGSHLHRVDGVPAGGECIRADVASNPGADAFVQRTQTVMAFGRSRAAHERKWTNNYSSCLCCSEKKQRIYRLGLRTAAILFLAIVCWVLDRFFCDTWWGSSFPYLHAIWHVLIFLSSYTMCVLFAYYAVRDECTDRIPDLKYWPSDNFELGIAFVSIKCYYSDAKETI